MCCPGYDFVNTDSNAADDNGHGTWVAGIIGAKPNDGYGIAGISWSDKILPVKIMSREGTGDTSDLTAGIIWAADHGATVINMSVGGFPATSYVQDAVNYAWNKGVVLVGAAGNNGRQEDFYPAAFTNVVSVSATQVDDEFAHWSSFGPKVDVSAPGASVQTTNCTVCTYGGHDTWGDHTYISGTSFATPNVAGVIALIRARYPSYTPSQVVSRLIATVDDLGYGGYDVRYGRGRVNAYRALGGSVGAPSVAGGDALESNNALSSAKALALGTTTRPSIYPAGDVDYFSVQVPRSGRLDVRVTGVVDTRNYPWNRSSLPIDPIVELYTAAGQLLKRVDAQYEGGTELASVSVTGSTKIVVRVLNFYANGSRSAYSITPTFLDNVAPKLSGRSPAPAATSVSYDGPLTATFDEAVVGVSSSSFVLKDASAKVIPATVTYSSSARRATLTPSAPLAAEQSYTATLTSGIKDSAGNLLAPASWSFTTGKSAPRVAGADRYATAASVSKLAYGPGVPVAFIATGASYPDALAGGPAARVSGGPLLLTSRTSLPGATANELSRLKPGRIVILGGTGSVASSVASQLEAFTTGDVTRLAGSDRYATAAAISASAFAPGASVVYVATGANFPDALAAGAAAARAQAPILLVKQTSVPSATAAELSRLAPDQIIVMGGTGMISDSVAQQLKAHAATVTRISGSDRYETAVKLSVAGFAPNSVEKVYVAAGNSFPDGLATGPVAGRHGAPLLLVPSTALPASVAAELRRLDPTSVIIVGGTSIVREAVRTQIRALWP